MRILTRDVFCGECGGLIGEQGINEDAVKREHADGFYFQFNARDDMDAHIAEVGTPHSGSTERIRFGPWKDDAAPPATGKEGDHA